MKVLGQPFVIPGFDFDSIHVVIKVSAPMCEKTSFPGFREKILVWAETWVGLGGSQDAVAFLRLVPVTGKQAELGTLG